MFGLIAAGAGMLFGGLSALGGSAQADAARDAAQIQADAAVEAARLTNESNERIEQMRQETQERIMDLQEELFNRQMDQAERQMVRAELRSLAGEAGLDTFNKVAGAFTTFVQVQNANEEKRALEMFGLEDRADLQPSSVVPSPYELTHTDLLTGETREEDYQLSSDTGETEEMLNEADQILNETEEI